MPFERVYELYRHTTGDITIRDAAGEQRQITSRDPTELEHFAHAAKAPQIDLVTSEGEAIGLHMWGDGTVVKPTPTIILPKKMIYLFTGKPVALQEMATHFCSLDELIDPAPLLTYDPSALDVQTDASQREITLCHGRRRDERQGRWKAKSSTFDTFGSFLQDHKVGEKDGRCFLQGIAAGGIRKSAGMISNDIIGLDLDSGQPWQEVIDKIATTGLECSLYTTHSHGKSESTIKRDHYLKWSDGLAPTEEGLRQYLLETKHMRPEIVATLRIVDESRHTEEGVVILVRHEPTPKFRAIFPLSEPFTFAKRGGALQDAIREWKESYAGFSTSMDLAFDEACIDPARLFYFPRHAEGAPFGSWRIAGRPVNLNEYERLPIKRARQGKARSQNPFVAVGQAEEERERYITSDGFNLKQWAAISAKRFEAQIMIEDLLGDDRLRDPRASGKAGIHVECPFEAEHSEFGGNGTFVVNASDSYDDGFDGGFTFKCVHNACADRDRLDLLKGWIDQGLIAPEDLANNDYRLALDDEEDEDKDEDEDEDEDKAIAPLSSRPSSPGQPHSLAHAPGKAIQDADGEEPLAYLLRTLAMVHTPKGLRVVMRPKPGAAPKYMRVSEARDKFKNLLRFEETKKGLKKIYAFDEWLEDLGRVTFDETAFAPGRELSDAFNTFTGWPLEPAPGDWSLLRNHMKEELCGGDEALFDWLFRWHAHMFQRPGEKQGSAIVITGEMGTGKSIVYTYFSRLLGRYFLAVDRKKKLVGDFNGHIEDKLLVVAEEMAWRNDPDAMATLRAMITGVATSIEKKGEDTTPGDNFTRFVFLSNHKRPVPVGGKDERRFLVLFCGNRRRGDLDFFRAMDEQMRNGGTAALFYDLLHYDPGEAGWDILRSPPETLHLQVQKRGALDGIEEFLAQLLESGSFEFEEDSLPSIVLDPDKATPVAAIELKRAAGEHIKGRSRFDTTEVDVPSVRDKAIELCGAELAQVRPDAGKNNQTILVFPKLDEARERFTEATGLPLRIV